MVLLVTTKAAPMINSAKKFAPRPRVKIQNSYFADYLIGFQMAYVDRELHLILCLIPQQISKKFLAISA